MATFHAAHRFARISARKVRLVADLVRGRSANEALDLLHATHKRAAFFLRKLVRSAVANAVQRPEVHANRLVLSEVWADGGPLKDYRLRWRPGPMGRMMPIRKRTSHIHVVLEDRAEPAEAPSGPSRGRRGAKVPAAASAPAKTPAAASAPAKTPAAASAPAKNPAAASAPAKNREAKGKPAGKKGGRE